MISKFPKMKAMIKIRKGLVLIMLTLLFSYGCSKEEVVDPVQEASLKVNIQSKKSSRGKVVHRVVIASKDSIELGVRGGHRGNLSLVANVYEDKSADGQWQDTFSNASEGIHVNIDCVKIEFTPLGPFTFASAIIGGYITKGKIDGVDVSGQYAFTKAIDLDYLVEGDRPNHEDFVSLSYNVEYQDCDKVNADIFEKIFLFSKGQVKIW